MTTPKGRKELVELMARAIFDQETYQGYNQDTKNAMWVIGKSLCTSKALAIMEAIEGNNERAVVPVEPTEAMGEAWASLAIKRIKQYLWSDEERRPGPVDGAKEGYRAMLKHRKTRHHKIRHPLPVRAAARSAC